MTAPSVQQNGFVPLNECWVCGAEALARVHETRFELSSFAAHDPDLHGYSGRRFWLKRCADCGFMQPEALPTLPGFFDRLYTDYHAMQLRTGPLPDASIQESMERDFAEGSKDFVFLEILKRLEARVPPPMRTLLDIGAHVGRFIYLAQQRGWRVEGIELNPLTSRFAAEVTRAPVHQISARDLALRGPSYGAVTLTDVLEHIPDPTSTIRTAYNLLVPGGCVSIKVPCGQGQLIKERFRSLVRSNYEFTIARNMYHVNHFGAKSLGLALKRAGFEAVAVGPGAPELFVSNRSVQRLRRMPANLLRRSAYYLSEVLPASALAASMNLLALGVKPGAGNRG